MAVAGPAVFLHTRVTDMRKGFDGLSGIVREAFGADPADGSLFLFVNRRRDRLKILHFDGTGFWLYYKRLEVGTVGEQAKTIDEWKLAYNALLQQAFRRRPAASA